MKKLIIPALCLALLAVSCGKDFTEEITSLQNDITSLKERVKANEDAIAALKAAQKTGDYITDVKELNDNTGAQIGWTFYFALQDPINVYFGKDGQNGADGAPGAPGEKGADGKIKDVVVGTDAVTFTLSDDSVIIIPIGNTFRMILEKNEVNVEFGAASTTVNYVIAGAGTEDKIVFVTTYATEGYSAEAADGVLTVTLPAVTLKEAQIIIQAVNNTTSAVAAQVLTVKCDLPKYSVKPLFGFQPTVSNPHGMTANAHRTMAVVGDYLILSNAEDVSKMPVYNRFTGEYLGDNLVNTSTITGLNDTQKFFAIASDDAGHLAAVTYVDTRETKLLDNPTVRGYVWKNGIDSAPASTWWAGFYNYATGASYGFSNMKIAGDLTGNAVVGTAACGSGYAAFDIFTDGKLTSARPKAQVWEGSSWWSGNVIPVNGVATGADDLEYITVSGQFRQYISYNNKFDMSKASSYWYYGGGTYQRNAIGGDWISVNGHNIFGVLNGWYAGQADEYSNNRFYYQLVVSEIGATASLSAESLDNGLIFASRSSANGNGLSGMGYGVQGMISPFAYENGETMIGPNAAAANVDQIGDVVLASTPDGKIQAYGFAMNIGLIAFEITIN